MITLGIKSNVDKLAGAFDAMAQRQVPFATSLALNRTAAIAKERLQGALSLVFDRPNPYTLNSLYVKNSTKTNLVARVEHKEFAGKGTPASKYLRPNIEGGATRTQKRSEAILSALAGIPGGFWTPGPGARLDAYGNVRGSQITQIISYLQAFGEVGYQANKTKKSGPKKVQVYFIVKAGNPRGLHPGVYQRVAGRIVPVLWIIPHVHYSKRYDMAGIVGKTVTEVYGQEFIKAMDFALATARVKLPA